MGFGQILSGQNDQTVFSEVCGICEETVGEWFVKFQELQESEGACNGKEFPEH